MSLNIQSYNKGTATFKNTLNYIRNYNEYLCTNARLNMEINPNYIHSAFNSTDIVVVSRTSVRQTRSSNAIQGFALVKVKPDHLYIDVLCAKGGGLLLIDRVESLARKMNKPYLMLNALPSVINLYKTKRGFVHSEKQCTENNQVKQLGNIVKSKIFSSSNNAMEDKEFKKLLKRLIDLKLTANKACKSVKSCSTDGYTMTKCLI